MSLGFQEDAEDVASISAWQSESMTGAVISSGYKHDGLAGMAWLDDDGELVDVFITYDLTNLNREANAALELLTRVFEAVGTPWCEMCENSGWIWSIDVVPVIPLNLVGDAIARYLRPCSEHASVWEPELAGYRWHWNNDTWSPVEGISSDG